MWDRMGRVGRVGRRVMECEGSGLGQRSSNGRIRMEGSISRNRMRMKRSISRKRMRMKGSITRMYKGHVRMRIRMRMKKWLIDRWRRRYAHCKAGQLRLAITNWRNNGGDSIHWLQCNLGITQATAHNN